MGKPDLLAQYKLFSKYYDTAYENDSLKDYQTADQLRKKIVPQILTTMDDREDLLNEKLFEIFADFVYEYYLCLDRNKQPTSHIEHELKSMAEKVIKINSNRFWGYFFLTVHHSFNLSSVHAGNGEIIYKSDDAAVSIVGTVINLLGKGLTLGATAAVAGVSKLNFTDSAKRVIETYKMNLAQKPFNAITYFKMTQKMFDLAEFCENVNNSLWRDLYTAIQDFDVNTLDYSVFDDEMIDEAKEQAMELIILADSKI